MSKIVLMRSMAEDPAGLLYMQNDRAVPVSIGTNLSLEDGALNATGGGGGGSLATMSDIDWGLLAPLATGDVIYCGSADGDPATAVWVNIAFSTIMSGGLQSALAQFPGFGPSKTFKTNAAGDGFEWV